MDKRAKKIWQQHLRVLKTKRHRFRSMGIWGSELWTLNYTVPRLKRFLQEN